jgi:hypothetical protein
VAGVPNTSGLTGNAEASILHSDPVGRRTTLDYRASANLGIVFNPTLGAAQQQVSMQLSSTWTHDKLSASLSGGAAATLPWDSPYAARTVSGTATVGYRPVTSVQLQTGATIYTQIFPSVFRGPDGLPTTLNTTPQWVAFVAVTVFIPVLAY